MTQDEVVHVGELPADGRQRGGDDGLVERRQEHGQQQAHQDGADFGGGQRRLHDSRRVAGFDYFCEDPRQFLRDFVRQELIRRDFLGQYLIIGR